MKQHIFFDIDRTLFQTDVWYKSNRIKIIRLFSEKYSLNGEKCFNLYLRLLKNRSSKLRTDIKITISELSDLLSINKEELTTDIIEIFLEEDYSKFVCVDVYETLDLLKENYLLGIFSEGDPWFQNLKIEKSSLIKYFDNDLIFLSQNKLEKLDSIPESSIIFDDSERIVDEIKDGERTDIQVVKVNPLFGVRQEDVDKILMKQKNEKY